MFKKKNRFFPEYLEIFAIIMLIDTHSHLNFAAFNKDRDEVINKCLENNIWLFNIGTSYETSKKAVEIAQKYSEGVYATIGLHPMNLDTGLMKIKRDPSEIGEDYILEREFDCQGYKELAKSAKVVAIGEVGLDYYWKPKTARKKELFKQKQKDLLIKQLEIAEELSLPVIFHCRVAHQDLLEVLTNLQFATHNLQLRGVMHGFVGDSVQLQQYLDLGLYIGFNGIIFKNIEGVNFEENIKITPLDKILLETDCPYLIPLPAIASAKAGFVHTRNSPLYIKYVAKKIAQIKKMETEEIAKFTTENAKRLFNL